MLELFRADGPGAARGGRRVLAFSLSAVGHAGILALAMGVPRPAPPEEAPIIVTLSLHSVVALPAPEQDAGRAIGDLAEPAGGEGSPAVEQRAPPSPKRVGPRRPAGVEQRRPRPPPAPPPPEPEAPVPVEPPARTVPAESRPVTLRLEPPAVAAELDGAGPPSPAAGLDESAGADGEPEAGGGLGSGHGGGEGDSRGGRRGKKRRSKTEADVLPELVHAPKPPYPARSRDLGEEGTVIIAILVDEKGRVQDSRVATSSGHPLLDGSALATVRRNWRFEPGRSAGEPVALWVRVPVEFRIRKR